MMTDALKMTKENKDMVKARLGVLLRDEKDPTGIRPCTAAETWGGRRCESYCDASEHCPQFRAKAGKG